MKLLDLFCGAGGSAMGYYQAGFTEIVGVDIKFQKRYPLEFMQGDALEYLEMLILTGEIEEYDLIHGSPPCQFGSIETPMAYRHKHKNYIPQLRKLLRKSNKPYVIENVENVRSHLVNPVKLCGTMFGLNIWRHRYFEIWPNVLLITPTCNHSKLPVLITGTTRRKIGGRFDYTVQQCTDAAKLHWMVRNELDQAIPPAYTKWLGEQMIMLLLQG